MIASHSCNNTFFDHYLFYIVIVILVVACAIVGYRWLFYRNDGTTGYVCAEVKIE